MFIAAMTQTALDVQASKAMSRFIVLIMAGFFLVSCQTTNSNTPAPKNAAKVGRVYSKILRIGAVTTPLPSPQALPRINSFKPKSTKRANGGQPSRPHIIRRDFRVGVLVS